MPFTTPGFKNAVAALGLLAVLMLV
ncbi:PGF-CTERM sorting domain-containing protein [Mucilaginibacter sp. E4BP6]